MRSKVWKKERSRPADTVHEYKRAVEMFIQLHGDLPVAAIKKSHARLYREDIQEVPQRRTGELLKASLPELSAWGRKHPEVPRSPRPRSTNSSARSKALQRGRTQTASYLRIRHGLTRSPRCAVQGEQSERTSFESR